VQSRLAWGLAAALAVAGCGGGSDGPPKPKTVQDAVTLGVLAAAKPATFGTSQLASEFCDLAGVKAEDVTSRSGGEPPIKFKCTLSFTLVNDPTTRFSVDYRTTLDSKGCFSAVEIPGSKQIEGTNEFDATGEPGVLAGCVKLPA
jgi:putative hemolysin